MSNTDNISASLFTTTYVDHQPLKVHERNGKIDVLIGAGTAGTQHLILPPESAQLLGEELLAAVAQARSAAA